MEGHSRPHSDYRRSDNGCVIINNNNRLSEIPQMGFGEGGFTQTLPLPLWCREIVFEKPSAQKSDFRNRFEKYKSEKDVMKITN